VKEAAFHLGLALLLTHELDAMSNHEWRVLPLVRALPEDTGMLVFVAAHVPLFAVVIALVASSIPRTRTLSRIGVGSFLVLHGIGHALSVGHPGYEFASTLSQVLIFGGAVLGALFLLLEWRQHGAEGP